MRNPRPRPKRVPPGHKFCPKCGEIKPHSDYWNSKTSPDGKGYNCKQCTATATRNSRLKHIDRYRAQNRRAVRLKLWATEYGITEADYNEMFKRQNGVCAICGNPETRCDTLPVDHNHATGQVRGLLCTCCNTAIGLLRDSPALCLAAAAYLARTQAEAQQVADEQLAEAA